MPALPFTAPALLAPMEGITEPCFRDLVLAANPPASLGGAFTEFVRVVAVPVPLKTLREHLGAARFPQPVGLQLMGSDAGALAESARRAVLAGAPLVDLNFGCPSKGALRGCAGSALLDTPRELERLVRACREAIPATPLTAKIRAGGADDALLEDLARAAESGGADLLTMHCRTRAEGFADTADWERLRRACAVVSIPVCGNGGVSRHEDLARLRRETGCHYVMAGRAALADPWIFSGRHATRAEAAAFLASYAARLMEGGRTTARGASARVKQLLNHWTAGDLVGDSRAAWLREPDPESLMARLRG